MSIIAWRLLFFGTFAMGGMGVSALLLGFIYNGISPDVSAASLCTGLALGFGSLFWIRRESVESSADEPLDFWELIAIILFGLVCLRLFFWTVYVDGGKLKVLLWNNLGDLSLHTALIKFLAQGVSFWPASPILNDSPLGYSFGVDLINACLLSMGVDWIIGYIWVGLIAAALTGLALYAWGRGFAVAAFLFNGGFVLIYILRASEWQDPDSLVDWKNVPLTLFATQRGFLYAFPAGLLLLAIWRARHAPGAAMGPSFPFRVPLALEWFLYASVPFFHLHTFIFLSFVLAAFGLLGERRRPAWILAALSLIPATIIVWLLTDGLHSGKHLALHPGWMQDDEPFITYWTRNFGLFLPLSIGTLVWFALQFRQTPGSREAKGRLLLLAVPFVVLLVTFFVRFAPWAWDNTKLIVWCYLMIIPALWQLLLALPSILRYVLVALLFASGAVTLFHGLDPKDNGLVLADRSELDNIAALVRKLPPEARIAAAPEFKHPLLLIGRPLVLGYEGHLVSHGLDYLQTKALLSVLMEGSDGWEEAARELGVRYLFWGEREAELWPNARKQWQRCDAIGSNPGGILYDLESGAL